MLTPYIATKDEPFIGDECAFCRRPLAPGDPVVLCPIDEVPHHSYCWEANGNHCSGFGCPGRGALGESQPQRPAEPAPAALPAPVTPAPRRATNQTAGNRPTPTARRPVAAAPAAAPTAPPQGRTARPERTPISMQFAQSCLVLAVAIAIVVIAFSCFGLWAILDYVMIDVMQWGYRSLPALP